MALVSFLIFHIEGFRHLGVGGYLGKFFPVYEFRNGIGAGIIAMFVGRKLQWDAAKEVFTGDGAKEANTHLAREMRKPYDYSYVA